MNQTATRVLWGIAGALLILAGSVCLGQPGLAAAVVAIYLGLSMLFSGVVDLVIYAKAHGRLYGAGWLLVDGILNVLLSIFLLFHESFALLSLPLLFGMWLLFSGISHLVRSLDLRSFGVRGWGWFCALGILFTAVGFLSFFNPVASLIAIGGTAGALMILQGAGYLLRAVFGGRFLR